MTLREPFIFLHIPGVPAYVTYTWIIMIILVVSSIALTRGLKLIPVKGQNFFEAIIQGFLNFMEGVMGPEGVKYFPLIGTLGFFIFLSNIAGLVPGFMSPTSNLNTTAACAVIVFVAYHFIGFRKHGRSYIKHFIGPMPALAPLMFPIEIIGHFARPLSLSMRLFGNIKGEDLVLLILAFLVPYLVPVPMILLAIFTSLIQAFVFVLLSMIYISGALHEAH
jgi:F-type H+-transporting ATPase subunit a